MMPSTRGWHLTPVPRDLLSIVAVAFLARGAHVQSSWGLLLLTVAASPGHVVCALSSCVLTGRGGCGAVRRRWLLARPAPFWLLLELRSSEELTLPEELRLPVKPLQALGEPGVPGREASLDACRA